MERRRIVVVAAALAAHAVGLLAAGQVPAPIRTSPTAPPTFAEGTGAISGVVIDRTTRAPIPGVIVYLGRQGRGAVGPLSRQLSDDKGRFVFTDLPAANNFFINASKPGYLEGHYGTGAAGQLGGLITLADDQWFTDASIEMERPASIGGTVLDEHGDPAVGVFVRVLARIRVAGHERLAAGPATRTDDRGDYRIGDLPPGRYLVQIPFMQQSFPADMTAADLAGIPAEQQAAGRPVPDPPPAMDAGSGARLVVGTFTLPASTDGRALTYAPVFYPGVSSPATASAVSVAPAEDHRGIDMRLRPAPAVTISGVVDGPDDARSGMAVRLLPEGLEDLGSGSEVAAAIVGTDGRFVLFNVAPGTYTLDVRRTISELQYRSPLSRPSATLPAIAGLSPLGSGGTILSGPPGTHYVSRGSGNAAYFARTTLVVGDRPVAGLHVPMTRASTIRGTIVTDTGEPLPARPGPGSNLPIFAEPADGNIGAGIPQSTHPAPDTFVIEGLAGGSYLLRFVGLGNWSVKSVVDAEGVDRLAMPFDASAGRDFDVVVTMTEQRIQLSGVVADARGGQVTNAIVLAFPVERDQWSNYGLSPMRLKGTPTTTSGTYQFTSLPAGDYYLVGVPPERGNAWQEPEMLAALAPVAARVSLHWGDVRSQPVTMVPVP